MRAGSTGSNTCLKPLSAYVGMQSSPVPHYNTRWLLYVIRTRHVSMLQENCTWTTSKVSKHFSASSKKLKHLDKQKHKHVTVNITESQTKKHIIDHPKSSNPKTNSNNLKDLPHKTSRTILNTSNTIQPSSQSQSTEMKILNVRTEATHVRPTLRYIQMLN